MTVLREKENKSYRWSPLRSFVHCNSDNFYLHERVKWHASANFVRLIIAWTWINELLRFRWY